MLKLKQLLLLIASMTVLNGMAHESFFAFAEVEYKEHQNKLEATISLTTHDLEKLLRINGNEIQLSKDKSLDSVELDILQETLNKGFVFNSEGKSITFILEGFDIQLNGITHFFLSAQTEEIKDLKITFDLLMDIFPEQQNKLTFIHRGKNDTYVFMNQNKSHKIDLFSKFD